MTTVASVHDLPGSLAAKSVPLDVIATVSYYNAGTRTLFVQDSTGAVYVRARHDYHLNRGDQVEIRGRTAWSYHTVVAAEPDIRLLRHVGRPQPRVVLGRAYAQIMGGAWDCRFVAVQGTVRSALIEPYPSGRILELEVMASGGLVQAYVQHFEGLDPEKLSGAVITLSGVVGADFNARWELMRGVLYATDRTDLQIVHPSALQPAQLRSTRIEEIGQTHDVDDNSRRVRVRGVVTFYRPAHSVVIEQDGRSLFAATRETRSIPLGSVVDVLGYSEEGQYNPTLGQTQIQLTDHSQQVRVRAVTYDQAVSGLFSDNLVSLRGRVLSEVRTDAADTLILSIADHPVTVELQDPARTGHLPSFSPDTLVNVTGICRVTASNAWGEPGVTPMLFRLDLRGPADVVVVQRAPWWTVAHLSFVLGGLLLLSMGITVWAFALRRHVALQNVRIAKTVEFEKQRSRLLEAITSDTPLEQVLNGICALIALYAPGLQCFCAVAPATGKLGSVHKSFTVGDKPATVLFRKSLTGRNGEFLGEYLVGTNNGAVTYLAPEQQEVTTIGVALTALAVVKRRLYEQLNYTSAHDGLTGLPNRHTVDAELEVALEKAKSRRELIGVAYIDIDHFKQVNDRYGHKSGDLYLQQIAARLQHAIRENDCVARIGGDEFLLVARKLSSSPEFEDLRERLRSCFAEPFLLDGIHYVGSASIGLAVFPDHGLTAGELKRHADLDMYAAKQRRPAVYNEIARPASGGQDMLTKAHLEAALAAGHFRLHYQPQFSPKGKLRGMEALLRLQDSTSGLIMPSAFIATAERSNLVCELGRWVLHQALADAASWGFGQHPELRVTINVAPAEVERPEFAEDVLNAIVNAGLPARVLELEITERSFIRDFGQATEQLRCLRNAGVRIALDDFGMEYASLSTLQLLPIDTLKIDRSFVSSIATTPEARPIVQAIVSLAHSMGKCVVAEGVETQAEMDILLAMGDVHLQGYLLGRPAPPESVAHCLEGWMIGFRSEGSAAAALEEVPAY